MRNSINQPSQRQLRVGEQIRHILAETLARGHFHDPILMDSGKITVTEVRVAPDLRQAVAYVLSLGGESMDKIIPALNNAASYFQREINAQATLKFTPRLSFKVDDSFENATRLESILNNLSYSSQPEDKD